MFLCNTHNVKESFVFSFVLHVFWHVFKHFIENNLYIDKYDKTKARKLCFYFIFKKNVLENARLIDTGKH